jgi:hypothetical protein
MIIQNSTLASIPTETTTPITEIKIQETAQVIAIKEVKIPKIILTNLIMPKDVIMEIKKSCTKFSKTGLTKKAYLKGTQYEITDLVQSLDSKITKFDPSLIRKNHLGNSKGTIKNIKDTAELQDIINQYWA